MLARLEESFKDFCIGVTIERCKIFFSFTNRRLVFTHVFITSYLDCFANTFKEWSDFGDEALS